MKKIKSILSIFVLALAITSCTNDKTLQEYLVESQDKTEFIKYDVPTSFIQLEDQDVSQDLKDALKSIRKINIVALPIKQDNKVNYEAEKAELKKIFKNKEYRSLMSMKYKGMNVSLYYTGETDKIDEIIAFGYGDEVGVGVARLLGDNINPALIMEMMDNVKMNPSTLNLEQLGNMFSEK
jgi:ribosomal protein L25 (general stress protein Ctc)